MDKRTIAILLSTYNSEKYLEEQLNSIVTQTDSDWVLYVRDDGSEDDTLRLLSDFAARNQAIRLLSNNRKNIGAMNSFMELLGKVDEAYYMFSDHDDVWLPDKIKLSRLQMEKAESTYPNIPVIVHSDLVVVDDNLLVKHRSFWRYSKIIPSVLEDKEYIQVFNCVTGCTMMFNSLAKKASIPYPSNIPMHDWWIAMRVAREGKIFHLDGATVLYRQHSANEIGAKNVDRNYFWSKMIKFRLTISGHKKQVAFLKTIRGHSVVKYLYYKLIYTVKRNW